MVGTQLRLNHRRSAQPITEAIQQHVEFSGTVAFASLKDPAETRSAETSLSPAPESRQPRPSGRPMGACPPLWWACRPSRKLYHVNVAAQDRSSRAGTPAPRTEHNRSSCRRIRSSKCLRRNVGRMQPMEIRTGCCSTQVKERSSRRMPSPRADAVNHAAKQSPQHGFDGEPVVDRLFAAPARSMGSSGRTARSIPARGPTPGRAAATALVRIAMAASRVATAAVARLCAGRARAAFRQSRAKDAATSPAVVAKPRPVGPGESPPMIVQPSWRRRMLRPRRRRLCRRWPRKPSISSAKIAHNQRGQRFLAAEQMRAAGDVEQQGFRHLRLLQPDDGTVPPTPARQLFERSNVSPRIG